MRPDPGNVMIEVKNKKNAQRGVVASHQAFPELRCEGHSPTEGLLALLESLKRSSPCSLVNRQSLALAHAVFDVESLLKLLVSSDRLKICGHRCSISKVNDLIYFYKYMTEEEQAGSVWWGPQETEESEDLDDTVVIYSVGRRFADRRGSRPGERPRTGQPERRRTEQRMMERRRCNRLKLIDRVSQELEERARNS